MSARQPVGTPPAYEDIEAHRPGSAQGSSIARQLFDHQSPERDAHVPDVNSLMMVLDQFRGRVQHLEEELESKETSTRVMREMIQRRDEALDLAARDAQTREAEFRDLMAQQLQITKDQQVAFAHQMEALKGDHQDQIQDLMREVEQIKIHQVQQNETFEESDDDGHVEPLARSSLHLAGGNPPKEERHVRFAEEVVTSTPRRPSLELSSIHHWSDGRVEEEPKCRPVPKPRVRKSVSLDSSKSNVTINSSQLSGVDASLILASELKKFREPKIQTLKGGYSSDAALFFNTWSRDVRSVVEEQQLTDAEAVRLVKDKTESHALKEVHYYLEMCPEPCFEGVLSHLRTAYTSGEDASTIASEFYNRSQKPKETEDSFADELQILARKLVHFRPTSKESIENELKHQFSNGLKDSYHGSLARSLLPQYRNRTFTEFRSEFSKVLGGRRHKGKFTAVTASVSDTSVDTPARSTKAERKAHKKAQKEVQAAAIRSLEEKLDTVIARSKQYQELLQPESLSKVISSSVSSHMSAAGYGKPFLGRPRPQSLRPGMNGNLDPTQECRYCKDKGHLIDNCAKLEEKKASQATGVTSNPRDTKKEN